MADQRCHLAGPHDQLGAVLQLVLVAREAPDQRVLAVVDPLDDIDELIAQRIEDSPSRSSNT